MILMNFVLKSDFSIPFVLRSLVSIFEPMLDIPYPSIVGLRAIGRTDFQVVSKMC